MKSTFFYEAHNQMVAMAIKDYLNAVPDFLSPQTLQSPRAVGDAIENLIAAQFDTFLGDWCHEYSASFARRAMADIAFTDKEGFYCIVDVKTHRQDTRFNMPNLTSVERLSRFYEDDHNVFVILMVQYALHNTHVEITDVTFVPIEFLDWECLTIGALGWGQIQIANSNRIIINPDYSRRDWMLTFCETVLAFYPREISKIQERMGRFEQIKTFWQQKQDMWR
ncbi:MAG: hypothetical protein KDD89_08040 [Anaerolineales bacterium]|nr:hypothetical protein [Anaerolineales bacterium]